MTALKGFERLEASGIWRASSDAQRRDVIVSFGKATLVISDTRDRALAHWSLAAVSRANPGVTPALYHPDGDPGETLELPEDETVMVDAIETVRRAVGRRRPRPGRVRRVAFLAVTAAVIAVALFWLPGALVRHTVTVVPDVKRAQIGRALAERITRIAGPACDTPRGMAALGQLMTRLGPAAGILRRIRVVRGGVQDAAHLPGGTVLLNRSLVEDHETPEVAAGYILAEAARAAQRDPLAELLSASGTLASFRLLTTGELAPETLDAYAQHLLTSQKQPVPDDDLLARFETAEVRSSPYAYAYDVSGESVLGLIEADPLRSEETRPVLGDSDWLSLQSICGG